MRSPSHRFRCTFIILHLERRCGDASDGAGCGESDVRCLVPTRALRVLGVPPFSLTVIRIGAPNVGPGPECFALVATFFLSRPPSRCHSCLPSSVPPTVNHAASRPWTSSRCAWGIPASDPRRHACFPVRSRVSAEQLLPVCRLCPVQAGDKFLVYPHAHQSQIYQVRQLSTQASGAVPRTSGEAQLTQNYSGPGRKWPFDPLPPLSRRL